MNNPLMLVAAVFCFSGASYAGHITSDSSLTLGTPVSTASTGSSAPNPLVWNPAAQNALWQLVPDPWGVNSSSKGSIEMKYTGGGAIVTTVNLTNLASKGVNGFPFVFLGHDPYGNHIDGQPVTFPAQLSTLSSLVADVKYSLSISAVAPKDLDIAYDEWIIPDASYAGGPAGALEVMIAPYYKFAWAPAGDFVGIFTEPVTVNGRTASMVFNEYSTGQGPGHEVLFFPRDTQIPTGDVRINLLDFMNTGIATAGIPSAWFLAGIEFGSEFGNTEAARYTVTTTKIAIEQDFIEQQ